MKISAFAFIFLFATLTGYNRNSNPEPGKYFFLALPHRNAAAFPKEVPILCYHNIKGEKKPGDYNVTPAMFKAHIRMLADSGYHTILPEQLYQYMTRGSVLPSKPVMVSFDDTRAEHFYLAAQELEKHGFRGVFFIMNISIGKPGYMSSAQIAELARRKHVIGGHSWDHQNMKKLQGSDWDKQISQPVLQLEKITGKPVQWFAYPSGLWDETVIAELKKRKIKAAFQLYGKRSESNMLFTIRRMIVPGTWSAGKLQQEMKYMFR